MEVFTKILKVFNTKDKVIDEANEYMKKYKDNGQMLLYCGLTNIMHGRVLRNSILRFEIYY